MRKPFSISAILAVDIDGIGAYLAGYISGAAGDYQPQSATGQWNLDLAARPWSLTVAAHSDDGLLGMSTPGDATGSFAV